MSDSRSGTLTSAVHFGDHVLGPSDAPVTLVEYGDYQCPYCAHAHSIINRVRAVLGPQLRFVFRNFPLSELHEQALSAARAAESVGSHAGESAFWSMHDALFEHQRDSDSAFADVHLIEYAALAGADPAQVARDLDEGHFEERVRSDFLSGVRSGVNGTPTFFINGVRFDGDWRRSVELIDALRAASSAASL
jgi:protein-disulfide isomerase